MRLGDELLLRCDVESVVPPSATWLRGNTTLPAAQKRDGHRTTFSWRKQEVQALGGSAACCAQIDEQRRVMQTPAYKLYSRAHKSSWNKTEAEITPKNNRND